MNNEKTDLLLLVDGSSYLHRAYHALPPLINSHGMPTGAIYGVINMLKKLLQSYQPQYCTVVFDAPGKTFRHQWYPQYKAHRPPLDQSLIVQIDPLKQLIQALGLHLICETGVEADDVIGSLAQLAVQEGKQVMISTADKDFAQLVNERITIINSMTDTILDRTGVVAKFGVTPEQIIDYLTLMGDASDNVPGVDGVGPKTAVKWLTAYGTLTNIIAHAEELTGKVGVAFRAAMPQLALTQKLVTIKRDLFCTINWPQLKITAPDYEELRNWFLQLEFKTWLKELPTVAAKTSESLNIQELTSVIAWQTWVNKIPQATQLVISGVFAKSQQLLGLVFQYQNAEVGYLPLYAGLTAVEIKQCLQVIAARSDLTLIGYDLKPLVKVFQQQAVDVQVTWYDLMLAAYCLNSSYHDYTLTSVLLRYVGKNIAEPKELDDYAQLTLQLRDLFIELTGQLRSADHQAENTLLQRVELPLMVILSQMELQGVWLDSDNLMQYSQELNLQLQQLEQQIYREAGEVFNVNSPVQLQGILYEKLKLPILHKTAKGQPSTAESVLQELAEHYALPQLILQYRSLAKLKSTYADALPRQIAPDGRLHTTFNQAVTTTGRLSSMNPNLQNIPARTEEGRRIRRAFIAPPGYQIVAADYSQIELRVMAHFANDQTLIDSFRKERDIHRLVAAEIFAVPLDEVTVEQRRSAKTINFGLIYGMSSFGLAQRIGLTRHAAQRYVELYFQRFPGVKQYMERMKNLAQQQGWVSSLLGRRIYLNDIHAKKFALRQAAERAAINAPIQSSAAEIIKLAMIAIANWLKQEAPAIKLLLQVHDELVFAVPNEQIAIAVPKIKSYMEQVIPLVVPLTVEVGVGASWDEAH